MKMIYKVLLTASLAAFTFSVHAQVGIGTTTPDASAQLDVTSNGKGVLIPRMTSSTRTGINPAAEGLLVYQTDAPAGFYYYSESQWVRLINSDESVPASVPSLYAGNADGNVIAVFLSGTSIPFPSNQIISSGFSANGSNTIFTAASAGRYQLSYSLKLTASVLVSARILVNGNPLAGSIVSPLVSQDKFATTIIADLPAGASVQVQFFGLLGVVVLATGEPQYLSILKLQ